MTASACVFPGVAALAEDAPPYSQAQDVVYGEVHGTGLLMDVFTPRAATNGLAIIDVASGAWHSDRSKIRDHTLAQMYPIYCARGYTVFAVRPGSKTRYTIADMDSNLKTGIRFVKEHASQYHIDPERLGLTGASAGGHLATLAALTATPSKPDAKKAKDRIGTSVKAVAVFFPPTDLAEWETGKPSDAQLLRSLLYLPGAAPTDMEEIMKAARAASPLYHVVKTDVPFFLIHGNADSVVPLSHSQRFVDAMKKEGNSAELQIKEAGGHAWLTIPEEVRAMAKWFDEKLGNTMPRSAP
ncbi:MAG: prolyl oligopeptidase family serine peptidase [Verrucomicrobia bacterium]|nr:prolyl oligopeptidase family serine peptidase [Verrucomicrobiota bacterium]